MAWLAAGDNFIGSCDLSAPPTSWLTTSAIGITGLSTAGVNSTGPNFCIQGNITAEYLQVAYHIDLPSDSNIVASRTERSAVFDDNKDNVCNVKDPRIAVCFPICGNLDWQEKIVNVALTTGTPWKVAQKIDKAIATPGWGITVMSVDYDNPITHLNASAFLDPRVWCSVYVGVNPTAGFPYLLDIQLGKSMEDSNI